MKKGIQTLIVAIAIAFTSFGQTPNGIKYQAVVRNTSGNILANQTVGFQLSIQEGSIGGPTVYTETFAPTSNSYGIINIEMGTGNTTDDFGAIDWANNSYFLETAIDVNGGNSYEVMGTSQFMSVPYAFHAKTVENDVDEQTLSYDNVSGELSISNGNTINLPMTSGGDNWGVQGAETDSTLSGDGTSANPLGVQGDLTDDQSLTGATLTGTSLQIDIENGNSASVDLAPLQDGVDDADADPTNELQDWSNLPGIPADIQDGDDNTQLSETEVDNFVANNGFITSPDDADADPTNELQDWSNLPGIPADIQDGDDNTQLSETEVDNFVANNGYITSPDDADADPTNELQDWSNLPGIPADIQDGDDNTQLSETEVDNFVANNGYITNPDDADADPTNELQDLSLNGNTLSLSNDASTVDLSSFTSNNLDEAYDQAGAGAGRTIDAVDGTVAINGEDGLLVTGTYGSGLAIGATGSIPEGAGTRMFFNPRKAAFRAGSVGTQWDDANVGDYSTAMGYYTTASGQFSTAMGSGTSASGNASTAMGSGTSASGSASTAMGINTTASGLYSTAMGYSSTASSLYSTAMGFITSASGYSSTAMGSNTTASGGYSTAMGRGTIAPSFAETTLGIYNTTYTPSSTTTWNTSDRLFVVGKGTSSTNRSDAFVIKKTGSVGIVISNPTYTLHVNGTAGKPGGGSWTATSDKRLKKNIGPYTDGLEQVLAIRPVKYQYNELAGTDTEVEYVGVIAQELQKVAPYMVGNFDLDGTGYLDVDNSAMTYMLINAVKEQQTLIERQKTENKALQLRLEKMESILNELLTSPRKD